MINISKQELMHALLCTSSCLDVLGRYYRIEVKEIKWLFVFVRAMTKFSI